MRCAFVFILAIACAAPAAAQKSEQGSAAFKALDTYEGRVQLSGFVEAKEQIARAGKVAAGVSGVRKVENNLMVK